MYAVAAERAGRERQFRFGGWKAGWIEWLSIAAMEALRHPKASRELRSFRERRPYDLEFSGIPTSHGMLRDRSDNHHG
jgi:hypothetical protein